MVETVLSAGGEKQEFPKGGRLVVMVVMVVMCTCRRSVTFHC